MPFLGAAANVSSPERGYVGLPLGSDVARELAKLLGASDDDLRGVSLDLAEVALETTVRTGRAYVMNRLERLLPDHDREPSPLLRTLARLPFKVIVTTNYDRLLERALGEAGREVLVVVQARTGFDAETMRLVDERIEESSASVVVYKLHGTLDSEATDVVIDEDDYIEFMRAIALERLPRSILSRLADGVLLFLGYSLRDWDFRMLYRLLPSNDRRTTFAVLREAQESYWLRYLQALRIRVCTDDIYDFADALDVNWCRYASS